MAVDAAVAEAAAVADAAEAGETASIGEAAAVEQFPSVELAHQQQRWLCLQVSVAHTSQCL